MNTLLSVISIIIGLILVVGLHELGHALAARYFGVNIKRVSIGFGRPLLSWQDKRGIKWVWALWPLGGYVHLQNTRIDSIDTQNEKNSFDKQSIWARFIILISGVIVNVLVAFVALVIVFCLGHQETSPVIGAITPNSIAANAGLKAGDQVVSMNDSKTSSWSKVSQQFIMHIGQNTLPIVVKDKQGQPHAKTLNMELWHYHGKGTSLLLSMGIKPDKSIANQHFVLGVSLWVALQEALIEIRDQFHFFVILFKQLLMGAISFSLLLGPIGLFFAIIHSFFQGLVVFLLFISNLSLSVAFVNILPLPGLDGASILYLLFEKMTGPPPSIALEVLLYRLAFIILCLLLLQLVINDFFHLYPI